MKNNMAKGFVHKFEDDINTDYIISSRYKRDTTDCDILKKYIFADIRSNLIEKIREGDIIAAGYNFGCGSAMEVASRVVKTAGFNVIIAKSFARSYYRNAMNNGILLINADTDFLHDGDRISIDLDENENLILSFEHKNDKANLGKISSVNEALYKEGGLIEYVNKYDRLPV
ncbi:3-isopropylmalate dehydratase small subunit [Synergistales bacterium]|nr:3-isopropylmalate dehydratase small subunit [Synergistales bacterium]